MDHRCYICWLVDEGEFGGDWAEPSNSKPEVAGSGHENDDQLEILGR